MGVPQHVVGGGVDCALADGLGHQEEVEPLRQSHLEKKGEVVNLMIFTVRSDRRRKENFFILLKILGGFYV